MSAWTHSTTDCTLDWVVQCPKCRERIDYTNVECPNCNTCDFMYVCEWHATVSDDVRHWWPECYLECRSCRLKTKSVPCPHDEATVLGMTLFNAYLPERPLKKPKDIEKERGELSTAMAWILYFCYFGVWHAVKNSYAIDIESPVYGLFGILGASETVAKVVTFILLMLLFISVSAPIASWWCPSIIKYSWQSHEG